MSRDTFSTRLLRWYDRHGRKTLPWKRSRDPYRIWVSEIMLQQTQVATVIPYFARFVARFPDAKTLARAKPDSVLHLWSGLGYYARARNLHRAAKRIVAEYGGKFPRNIETVRALPGIGRSTAGAILALAFGSRHPILDGNVRRVLARYHAIGEPPSQRETEEKLWRLAERHTTRTRVADYTQAIMDLGATLCTPANPDCHRCPVRMDCRAYRLGTPQDFPVSAKRKALPVKQTKMLLLRDGRGRVLLVKRPPAGLWGGLWGLPECTDKNIRAWCRDRLGLDVRAQKPWPAFRHSFSHFHLDITPIPTRLVGNCNGVMGEPEKSRTHLTYVRAGERPTKGEAGISQTSLGTFAPPNGQTTEGLPRSGKRSRKRSDAGRAGVSKKHRAAPRTAGKPIENNETVWYNVARPDARGLAAPVTQLLERLKDNE